MDFSWMAWTKPTAIFFVVIFGLIAAMGVWEKVSPGGAPRKGVLGIQTHRGDRLFITLLGAGFIHIGWLLLTAYPLWGATILSVVYGVIVFSFV
jgi:predicted small integral membrane protein